jgi:molecular chaperone Hsp33
MRGEGGRMKGDKGVLVRCLAEKANLRGVAVEGTPVVEAARKAQDTWPTATAAFGRLLMGALLFTAFLEDDTPQRVSLQVLCQGPIQEIFAEADAYGAVRGYAANPHVHVDPKEGKLDVKGIVGEGTLHVVKDLGIGEPYHSSIPLVSGELAMDLAYYLVKSEQIPSAMALGVKVSPQGSVESAGGLLVHTVGEVPDKDLARLEEAFTSLGSISHLMAQKGPRGVLEEILGPWGTTAWVERPVEWRCRCSKERAQETLIALGREELEKLLEKGGTQVECRFCGAVYGFSREEIEGLLKELEARAGEE